MEREKGKVMNNETEPVPDFVGYNQVEEPEQLSAPPPSIKMKKQYDPVTKGYVLVAKNPPAKVLVPRQITSPKKIRKMQLAMLAQYGLRAKPVSDSEVKARLNRISTRLRRKKIAEKTKWKNYRLAQEVR